MAIDFIINIGGIREETGTHNGAVALIEAYALHMQQGLVLGNVEEFQLLELLAIRSGQEKLVLVCEPSGGFEKHHAQIRGSVIEFIIVPFG